LRALEQDGYITGAWEIQPSGPARKVYSLTEQGRVELVKQARAWQEYARAVNGILGGQPDEQPA